MTFLLFLAVALALGFKHSYDADHLVAVSSVLTRARGLRHAGWLGLSWAAGHMVTATMVTIFLFLTVSAAGAQGLPSLEGAVAVMLLVIGGFGLALEYEPVKRWWRARFHRHEHDHGPTKHAHDHPHLSRGRREHGVMLGIGIVHGLASNDELLVLFVLALGVTSLASLLVGVGVFSLGVVLGMTLFSWAVAYPMRRWGTERVQRLVNVAAAVLSLAYGVLLLAGFEGFNPFG
jgi:hypothetical protein